jgi:hypothetical protein
VQTRHCLEASGTGSERATHMANRGRAAATGTSSVTSSAPAVASSSAAPTVASAAAGRYFDRSQDEEGACKRDRNSPIHGSLHAKMRIPQAPIGHQSPNEQSGDTLTFFGIGLTEPTTVAVKAEHQDTSYPTGLGVNGRYVFKAMLTPPTSVRQPEEVD